MFISLSDRVQGISGYLPGRVQPSLRFFAEVGSQHPSTAGVVKTFRDLRTIFPRNEAQLPFDVDLDTCGYDAIQLTCIGFDWLMGAYEVISTTPTIVKAHAAASNHLVFEAACNEAFTKRAAHIFQHWVQHLNMLALGHAPNTDDFAKLENGLPKPDLPGKNSIYFVDEALSLGLPVLDLPQGVVQIGQGRHSHRFNSSLTEKSSATSARLCQSKSASAALLRMSGLPVPAHAAVKTIDDACLAASKIGYPVVLKPEAMDGGLGVYPGLLNEAEVRSVYPAVRRLSANILVEKHVDGRDYRLVVFQGQCVAAIERAPGGVTGNGSESISTLIDAYNKVRGDGVDALSKLYLDEEAHLVLRMDGRMPDQVPATGEFVRLRRTANFARGGSVAGVMDKVHPDNAALAIRAAEAMRIDLAGIDLIMPDVSRSWLETGAAICEINAMPNLGTRKHLNLFNRILTELLPGGGRIPVAAVVGEPADLSLREHLHSLAAGFGWGVVDPEEITIGGQRSSRKAGQGFGAMKAVILDPRATGLLFWIDDLQFEDRGLPVDQIDLVISFAARRNRVAEMLLSYGKPALWQVMPDGHLPAEPQAAQCDLLEKDLLSKYRAWAASSN